MNRRDFLKSLFATGALVALDIDKAIEQTLVDTINLTDGDFVAYITYTMKLYIHNPAQCMIITGIEE